MSEWTADSNEALTLSFGSYGNLFQCEQTLITCSSTVRASEDKEMLSPNESYEEFHPTFTYPVRADVSSLLGTPS